MAAHRRLRSALLFVLVAAWLTAAAGCGDSAVRQTIEGFLGAAREHDCEKMVDYVDLDTQGSGNISRADLVKACKDEGGLGNVTGWSFTGERVEGDTATVGVELTVTDGGQQQANRGSFNLIRKEGVWKLTTP